MLNFFIGCVVTTLLYLTAVAATKSYRRAVDAQAQVLFTEWMNDYNQQVSKNSW